MSCPHLDTHLRTDLDRETRMFLESHARECPECQHRLEIRRRAYALITADVPPLTPTAQAAGWLRLEAAIDEQQRQAWWPWAVGLGGALAAAATAAAFFSLRPIEPPAAPMIAQAPPITAPAAEVERRTLGAGEHAAFGELRISARTPCRVEVPSGGNPRRLRLLEGEVEISVGPTPPGWIVVTPHGELTLLGAQIELGVDDAESRARVGAGAPRPPFSGAIRWPAPAVEPGPVPGTIAATSSPPRARRSTPRQVLEEARALIGRDDQQAVALAEGVIKGGASGPDRVVALMIAADGWRRRGGRSEAEDYYRQAAEHPEGQAFVEEASLRRAALLEELGRADAANVVLTDLDRAWGSRGSLHPERSALWARVLLAQGQVERAARVLVAEPSQDRVLEEPRVRVAEALSAKDPAAALALIQGITNGPQAARAAQLRAAITRGSEK